MRRVIPIRVGAAVVQVFLASLLAGCSTSRLGQKGHPPLPPGSEEVYTKAAKASGREPRHKQREDTRVASRGDEEAESTPATAPRGAANVLATTSAALSPSAVTNMTVSVWLKCAQLPTLSQGYAGIIGKFDPSTTSASEWLIGLSTNGKIYLATTGAGSPYRLFATNAITLGQWVNVCAEFKSSGMATLYINASKHGALQLQAATQGNTPVFVGDTFPASGAHVFAGNIDEIKVLAQPIGDGLVASLYSEPPKTDADGDGLCDYNDPDDNNDGVPDEWAAQYFGDRLQGGPGEDPDRDAFPNRNEYIAGTDPTDGDSFFHIANFLGPDVSSNVNVNVAGRAGRIYRVSQSTSLRAPAWSQVGQDMDCRADGPLTILVPSTNRNLAAYYKMDVRLK